MITKQLHQVARPEGLPEPHQFAVREVKLRELAAGEVLVENLYMSIDPYMRRSMDSVATDMEPWPLHGALNGPSIGRVVQSRNAAFAEGDIVESMSGWQEHFISGGDKFITYISADNAIAKRDINGDAQPKDFLGLLGIAAQTAYFGMTCAADPQAGETVVISSGAGTVGSVACQIGKIGGLRVVTSAGSDAKVRWLRESLRVDYAFNYKLGSIGDELAKACPDGIDLVLENASAEHFSACLPLMNDQKTMLIAGFISIYSTGGVVDSIKNFQFVLDRYLTIKAFPFMNYLDAYERFVSDMLQWRRSGQMQFEENICHGLEAAPAALCALFNGNSHGKSLVKLAD